MNMTEELVVVVVVVVVCAPAIGTNADATSAKPATAAATRATLVVALVITTVFFNFLSGTTRHELCIGVPGSHARLVI